MCICINCKHIKYCQTYFFIEIQHNIYIHSKNHNFIPINTLIQINITAKLPQQTLDWDLVECLSFSEQPGSWLII